MSLWPGWRWSVRPSDVRPAWERRLLAEKVLVIACLLATVAAVAVLIARGL